MEMHHVFQVWEKANGRSGDKATSNLWLNGLVRTEIKLTGYSGPEDLNGYGEKQSWSIKSYKITLYHICMEI